MQVVEVVARTPDLAFQADYPVTVPLRPFLAERGEQALGFGHQVSKRCAYVIVAIPFYPKIRTTSGQ
ncbi:MAG: hypothetical protein ABW318_06300 [Vicinamibacterales bacterium]